MNAKEYGKALKDPKARERFEQDPFANGRGHCHDCGQFPAYIPKVMVANIEQGITDKYQLQLPHLCSSCVTKRGLTHRGLLVPRTRELQGPTEMLEEHLKRLPEWIERVRAKTVKEISREWDISEEEARQFMGYVVQPDE